MTTEPNFDKYRRDDNYRGYGTAGGMIRELEARGVAVDTLAPTEKLRQLLDGSQWAKSGSGQSIWHYVHAHERDALSFLVRVAQLRMDGEGVDGAGDPWIMENDEAYYTLHRLIEDARDVLGWKAGEPPLESVAEYSKADE